MRTPHLIAVFAALTFAAPVVPAAQPAGAARCHEAAEPVACFLDAAQDRLKTVKGPDERADAVGELLYALAETGSQNDALLREALALSDNDAVKPVKRMDLLYSIDLYGSASGSLPEQTYLSALSRFAVLERELKGLARVELYVGACSIIGWDDPFRERWLEFAQSVCTPEKLRALNPAEVTGRALLLAMMPVAMTFGDNRDGFVLGAERGLSWLAEAEKAVARSKRREERDFVAFMGVLMHTMNALCLDAFDLPEAADSEVDLALKLLRRHEKGAGAATGSVLRRQTIEILHRTGRSAETKKMLRELLARADSDRQAKRIPAAEQVALFALAARIEHDERLARESQSCTPEGGVEI